MAGNDWFRGTSDSYFKLTTSDGYTTSPFWWLRIELDGTDLPKPKVKYRHPVLNAVSAKPKIMPEANGFLNRNFPNARSQC